jgi:hypothetical protein
MVDIVTFWTASFGPRRCTRQVRLSVNFKGLSLDQIAKLRAFIDPLGANVFLVG